MRRTASVALLLPYLTVFSFSQDQASYRSLEERRSQAASAGAVREAFFSAAGNPPPTLEAAFGSLNGAPIDDPTFLAARRSRLRDNVSARARERLTNMSSPLAALVASVCDAEDAADALEERVLAALEVGLELAPGFHEDAMSEVLETLREQRRAADRVEPESDAWPEASAQALEAAHYEQRLRTYQRQAMRRMVLPSDRRLVESVLEDIERAPHRLNDDLMMRATPLLPAELAAHVAATVGSHVFESDGTGATDAPEVPEEEDPPEGSEQRIALEAANAEIVRMEQARYEDSLVAIASREQDGARLDQTTDAAMALSLIDPTRVSKLLQAFHASQDLVTALRTEVHAKTEERAAFLRDDAVQRSRFLDPRASADGSQPRRDAYASFESSLALRREHVDGELSRLMDTLESFLVSRRRLIPLIDYTTRREAFPAELSAEITEAPLWLRHSVNDELRYVRTIPDRMFDLNALWQWLTVSFDLLILVIAWVYLRKASARWLRRRIDALRKKQLSRFGWQEAPRYIQDREIAAMARYGIASMGALVLHYLLVPRSTVLAFFALVWMSWALLKFVPKAVRITAVVSTGILDPLGRVNAQTAEEEAMAVRTASWFLWWWILTSLAAVATVPLLQADAMRQLVRITSAMALAMVVLVSLAGWAPRIRTFIQDLADQSFATEWLGRPSRSRIYRIVRAGCGALFIGARVVFWLLVDRGWLSRSGTELVVSQFKLVDAGTELLSREGRARIEAAEAPWIERDTELDALMSASVAWHRDRRLGVVAIIGDHGMGKTSFLEAARGRLESEMDLPVTRLQVPARARSKSFRDQLEWLTTPLNVDVPKNSNRAAIQKLLVETLESQPPTIFIIDDVHLLLRRVVGGFDLLEAVAGIVQACSDEHFWVLGLHRPAWSYIDGVSDNARLVFRQRIELPGLDANALESTLTARTRNAGYEPAFDKLLQRSQGRADDDKTAAKARSMYWRIVTQASQGNPDVALDFWLSSLGSAVPADNGELATVPVYLALGHADTEVEKLSDHYLFLLTALVVHDGLKLADLADVLNLPVAETRSACQTLQSLNILEHQRTRFIIAPVWQPAVLRVLDRKNFAHR